MLIEEIERLEKKIIVDALEQRGEVRPRIMLVMDDSLFYFDFQSENRSEEEKMRNFICLVILSARTVGRFQSASMIGEAWVAPKEGIMPSKSPKRREVVLLSIWTASERSFSIWEIDRSGEKPHLGDVMLSKNGQSWMDRAFEPLPEQPPDDVKKAANDLLNSVMEGNRASRGN